MPYLKECIVDMIDYLPEKELTLLYEITQRFIPDDIQTFEDLSAIKKPTRNTSLAII